MISWRRDSSLNAICLQQKCDKSCNFFALQENPRVFQHRRHSELPPAIRGFTLVELLVAVVLIATLATLAVTAANAAMLRAKEARCGTNLRNIGIALHAYAGEHGGSFPETTHSTSLDRAWISALEAYLGDYNQTRVCPADPRAKERTRAGGTSYILNSFLFVPETDAWGDPIGPARNRPSLIPAPELTILAFICADSVGTGPGNDHTHSNRWSTWSAVTADIAPGRFGGGRRPADARGRANYLYADASVQSIAAITMKQKTDSGINIALPPGLP
jgi:prepilin-type N-terminal cleavage/methylation domain-containing protein/prepilin-type processing-associated H-X9-DG protein